MRQLIDHIVQGFVLLGADQYPIILIHSVKSCNQTLDKCGFSGSGRSLDQCNVRRIQSNIHCFSISFFQDDIGIAEHFSENVGVRGAVCSSKLIIYYIAFAQLHNDVRGLILLGFNSL